MHGFDGNILNILENIEIVAIGTKVKAAFKMYDKITPEKSSIKLKTKTWRTLTPTASHWMKSCGNGQTQMSLTIWMIYMRSWDETFARINIEIIYERDN